MSSVRKKKPPRPDMVAVETPARDTPARDPVAGAAAPAASAPVFEPPTSDVPRSAMSAGAAPAETAAPVAPPDDGLRGRLAQFERAQQIQQQIHTQMQPTPRDVEFIQARPGILNDPRFLEVVRNLPGWPHDEFYHQLEARFPIGDYQNRQEPAPPQPEPKEPPVQQHVPPPRPTNGAPPRYASEVRRPGDQAREDEALLRAAAAEQARGGPVYAAPPTREVNYSGRPAPTSRVTLSPAEREICRINKISESDYAKGKLALEARKASGMMQQDR
jgi:hypothetical protein